MRRGGSRVLVGSSRLATPSRPGAPGARKKAFVEEILRRRQEPKRTGCARQSTLADRSYRANLAQGGLAPLWGFVRFPCISSQSKGFAMKALVPIVTLILAIAFSAPAPKNQSACEKAGMKWDATAMHQR
jgi:hypothetical protein